MNLESDLLLTIHLSAKVANIELDCDSAEANRDCSGTEEEREERGCMCTQSNDHCCRDMCRWCIDEANSQGVQGVQRPDQCYR